MAKWKNSFVLNKVTLPGKLLNIVSWFVLFVLILIGSAMLATEFSVEAILFCLLCAVVGIVAFLILQALIAWYEEKCAQKRNQQSLQREQGKAQPFVCPPKPDAGMGMPVETGFDVQGKRYRSMDDLCVTEMIPREKMPRIFTDIHRRSVIYYTERYPCFDEFDRLYEDRVYHHFLILSREDYPNESWAHVRFDDGMTGEEVLAQHLTRDAMKQRISFVYYPLMDEVAEMRPDREETQKSLEK